MGIQINGQTDTVTAIDGSINVGGNVTIPGVLTYEDVTNVDSVGIITAQAGIHVTGGSVGLGTDNPSQLLHLHSDSAHQILLKRGGQYPSECKFSNSGNLLTISNNKNGIHFDVGSSSLATAMYIEDGGNIGINSTNPSTPLELYTDISSAWKFRINTSVSDGAGFYQRSNGDFEMVLRDSSNNNNYIAGTSGALQFAASGSEKLRIASDGDVGIGTNNPGSRLDVRNASGTNPLLSLHHSNADVEGEVIRVGRTDLPTIRYHSIKAKHGGAATANYITFNLHDGSSITSQSEILRLRGDGAVGIGTNNPADILHLRNAAPILTTEATNASSGLRVNVLGQTSDSSQLFRVQNDNTTKFTVLKSGNVGVMDSAPSSLLSISQTNGNAKLQIKRSNTANDTDDYGSILWRSSGGTAVGGINVARATAENDGYMFFQTTESGSNMTERLRILSNGTIRKGTSNGANGKQPIELFFQKRSTQIGKRVHQGSGVNATTHNILNIDSWQSANSHAFIYVTVYYVSPVTNYGGRMECYATAVNSGGNVSGGQGTFATSDAGRWGNPGVPSLSWSGSTLRFTTLAHAYIDYSLDITCIAYDGAVVSFYSN